MSPESREPEPGTYIAFLARFEPGEAGSAKGRYRSEFLFDAITMASARPGNVRNAEPASRPLFRLKTTRKRFEKMTGREARAGDWFLLEIIRRHGGSWVWAAVEDADYPTGYRPAGNFSATSVQYLDPNTDFGPARDADIAKAFLLVKQTYSLLSNRNPRRFRWLERALTKTTQLFVEVVDVGQASFISIHDGQNSYIYFDAGLPLWFNAKSLPTTLHFFPPHKHAVVVLSHWDYDHYSAVQKYQNLNALRCVAPAGDIGPNAGKLARQMGRRLWRLDYGQKTTIGPLKLRWADGPIGDKNNRAIIGIVEIDRRRILLTGDASYSFIKPRYRSNLTGTSIPHHASIHSHSAADIPASVTPAIAIVSAGHSNKYGHPNGVTMRDHSSAHWNVEVTGAYPSKTRGNKRF